MTRAARCADPNRGLRRAASPVRVAQAVARAATCYASDVANRRRTLEILRPFLPPPELAAADGSFLPQALGSWARSIRYMREPSDVGEIVLPPATTAKLRSADCDCLAAAVCGFAAILGLPCAVGLAAIGDDTDPETPRDAHAFALLAETWTPTDTPVKWTWHIDHEGARRYDRSDRDYPAMIFPVRASP